MALSDSELITLYPGQYWLSEEDEEMSESAAQFNLILYLTNVLRWFYRVANWLVLGNLELRHPAIPGSQHKITPDILVFKGVTLSSSQTRQLTSWNVESRGAPTVIFEVSSYSTWPDDIQSEPDQKPAIYGRIGVKEYWAYDPNEPAVWQNVGGRRLLGWRYNHAGEQVEIEPDKRGWYWSAELESWLSADEEQLQLHDVGGNPRLEEGKAERQARTIAEQVARQAEQVARQAEEVVATERQARQAAEAERQAAEAVAQAAREEAERQAQQIAELERELRRLRGERAE